MVKIKFIQFIHFKYELENYINETYFLNLYGGSCVTWLA
jgi:hypothetical protein